MDGRDSTNGRQEKISQKESGVRHTMEKLLWSVALPGFGHLLYGKYLKGILFILLEFIINIKANLNVVIISSFHGNIQQAIEQVDYEWLLFYPCLYFFVMWDAYKGAGGGKKPYSFLPFVSSAYIVTVGTVYSSTFTVFGVLLGPVWLPILSMIPGWAVGMLLQKLIMKLKPSID